MALAVAGALAAPAAAFAQASNVQIYGTFDVSINSINHSGTTNYATGATGPGVTKWDVYNQSSRLGFKGVEDLGNGLKAWFQAENNIAADGRQFNNTAGIGGRNTAVGLEGSFGNVLMGNWDSPYKAAEGIWNISNVGGYAGLQNSIMHNQDNTGANPNLNCQNAVDASGRVPVSTATGLSVPVCGQLEMAATSFSNRMSNTIQYWSPVFSGVQIKFAMRANEEKNDAAAGTAKNSPQSWATTINWTAANAGVTFGYEKHVGWRDIGPLIGTSTSTTGYPPLTVGALTAASAGVTTPNDVQDTAWTLGGNYNFGVVQVAAAMERMSFGNNYISGSETNFERKNYYLGLAAPVGNGTIRAGYAWTPGLSNCGNGIKNPANLVAGAVVATGTAAALQCSGDTKAQAFQLGYEYNLSKRTAVYGSFAKMDNANNSAINFSTPVLTQGATTGTLTSGQDVTVWGAGIKHSF